MAEIEANEEEQKGEGQVVWSSMRIRLPEFLRESVEEAAREDNCSLNQVVVGALTQNLMLDEQNPLIAQALEHLDQWSGLGFVAMKALVDWLDAGPATYLPVVDESGRPVEKVPTADSRLDRMENALGEIAQKVESLERKLIELAKPTAG